MTKDTRIAGSNTAEDWARLKERFEADPSKADWDEAFDEFLMERLNTRYLLPIEAIKSSGNKEGEGFAITTILCALIEFLAALEDGAKYKLGMGKLGGKEENVYGSSGDLFQTFLKTKSPFSDYFNNTTAESFYKSVRCGLLHEAATKDGWRILTSGEVITCSGTVKSVNRNALKAAIDSYLLDFRHRLQTTKDLQEAFIRKFDWLAED